MSQRSGGLKQLDTSGLLAGGGSGVLGGAGSGVAGFGAGSGLAGSTGPGGAAPPPPSGGVPASVIHWWDASVGVVDDGQGRCSIWVDKRSNMPLSWFIAPLTRRPTIGAPPVGSSVAALGYDAAELQYQFSDGTQQFIAPPSGNFTLAGVIRQDALPVGDDSVSLEIRQGGTQWCRIRIAQTTGDLSAFNAPPNASPIIAGDHTGQDLFFMQDFDWTTLTQTLTTSVGTASEPMAAQLLDPTIVSIGGDGAFLFHTGAISHIMIGVDMTAQDKADLLAVLQDVTGGTPPPATSAFSDGFDGGFS